MADDSVFEEALPPTPIRNLSRSPSPTLIFPLPNSKRVPQGEEVSIPDSALGASLMEDSPGTEGVFTFNPPDDVLDKSQNSIGGANSSTCRSFSRSPESRRMRRMRSRTSREELSSSSPLLPADETSTPKRSPMVVTDLDQAMAQMDEMKLRSIFGQSPKEDLFQAVSLSSKNSVSSDKIDEDVDETNIDDDPQSAKIMSTLRQKSVENSLTPEANTTPKTSHHATGRRRQLSTDKQSTPVVSFQDAIKWPEVLQDEVKLDSNKEFDGETLTTWLSCPFDSSHYLHAILTRHDLRVIMAQVCTHLLAAGVLVDVDKKYVGDVFKTQNQYRWGQQEHHVEAPPISPAGSPATCRVWPPGPEHPADPLNGSSGDEGCHLPGELTSHTRAITGQ